jgi:hypothetical protein
MAGVEEDMPSSPFGPLLAELARMRKSNLNAAINDVDSIIDLLTAARDQVAGGTGPQPKRFIRSTSHGVQSRLTLSIDDDAHRISMAMTTLQNPVKAQFEAITDDLKDVTKAQRSFGKALDKVS